MREGIHIPADFLIAGMQELHQILYFFLTDQTYSIEIDIGHTVFIVKRRKFFIQKIGSFAHMTDAGVHGQSGIGIPAERNTVIPEKDPFGIGTEPSVFFQTVPDIFIETADKAGRRDFLSGNRTVRQTVMCSFIRNSGYGHETSGIPGRTDDPVFPYIEIQGSDQKTVAAVLIVDGCHIVACLSRRKRNGLIMYPHVVIVRHFQHLLIQRQKQRVTVTLRIDEIQRNQPVTDGFPSCGNRQPYSEITAVFFQGKRLNQFQILLLIDDSEVTPAV